MDVFDIEVDQKYWDSIICDDLEESENILNFENCLISAVNLNHVLSLDIKKLKISIMEKLSS